MEAAILDVKPGQETEFGAVFREAESTIASMNGYVSHQLQRCLEDESRHIRPVNWEALEDHTEGFCNSAEYQQWKQLLHYFYEPFPTVEHYTLVTGSTA